MSKYEYKNIENELHTYIENIEKDYKKLENILQNQLLIKDKSIYINYKLKIFQSVFHSLESNKKKLLSNITKINKVKNNNQNFKLFNKYPNIIDKKFNTKIANTDIIKQYTGINNFIDISKKLYATYTLENNNINNINPINENKYSIWKLSAMQKILRNFISPETPYYGAIIIHGTGVGKTCTAITIAENFKDYVEENNTQIQIIRPDEFQRQIFEISKLQQGEPDMQCTGTDYIDSLSSQTSFMENVKNCQNSKNKIEKEKACIKVEKSINNKIKEYYNFKSRALWAKSILKLITMKTKGLTGLTKQRKIIEIIRQEFNNSIIIIDEVHNIRNLEIEKDEKDGKDKDINEIENLNLIQILELVLLIAQNIRIVLLSATPMYDRASDIIPLFNLLLLNDYRPRITEKELFIDDYGSLIPEIGAKRINQISRGYISYVRGNDPINFPLRLTADNVLPKTDLFDVNKYPKYDITGKKIINDNNKIKYFKLVNCILSNEHSHAIINKDKLKQTTKLLKSTSKSNLLLNNKELELLENTGDDYKYSVAYSTELQLGNFMYKTPKETEGNFTESYGINGFNSCFSKNKSGSYVANDEEYLSRFKGDELNKYSPKIFKILSSIENAKGPVAIYSNFINGGLIPVVIALEMAGYTRYNNVNEFIKTKNKPDKSKGTYVLFTGDKMMSKGGDKYVNLRSNMIKEMDVKIFLFSSAGSEGLSLYGYREIHILEPWHNINLMEQSIGRIIRNKSHHHLMAKKRNATIYMYTSTFDKEFSNRESIDLRIYSICEQKAIAIGKIETLFKSNAFDCVITRELNIRNNLYFGKKIDVENSHGKTITITLEDSEYSRDTSYGKNGEYICNNDISKIKVIKSEIEKDINKVSKHEFMNNIFDLKLETDNKLKSQYFIEIRELKQLIIKILQHQGNLGYNDILRILKNNLDLSLDIKKKLLFKFIEFVFDELNMADKNNVIINSKGELCKIFVMESKKLKNLKSINSSNKILRLLPLNKYDPNLDLLYQKPLINKNSLVNELDKNYDKSKLQIKKNIFKNIDYSRLDIDKDKNYEDLNNVDLIQLIELKKNKLQVFQKTEELDLVNLLMEINDKLDFLYGIKKDNLHIQKFNLITNFNIHNKSQIGKEDLLCSIVERLLPNEKTFLLMYLIIKIITVSYHNCSELEKSILYCYNFNIISIDELNFLQKINIKKTSDISDNEEKHIRLQNLTSKNIKGFIIVNHKEIKYYELLDLTIDINKINDTKLTSFTYLKTFFKNNKVNIEKVLKSKYKQLSIRTISRLYGYLIYEKQYQQPKFKITDYISRGFKKSVKGIFCSNKHINEIEKLINILVPKKYIKHIDLIKNEKKNKKLYCGDLEIFFRIRNSVYKNSFDSRLDANNIYFLSPEEYYIWQKYNNTFI